MFVQFIRCCYYALFVLTPLILSIDTSEMFEFNKLLFIYLISVLATSAWLFDVIIHGRQIRFYRYIIYLLLFFLLIQSISTLFSIDVETSIFGYYGRFHGGLLSVISYLLLIIVAWQYFDFRFIRRLWVVSSVVAAVVVLWGLPGWWDYDLTCIILVKTPHCWGDAFRPTERMFSTLGQPNWLGAYLVINFFVTFNLFCQAWQRRNLSHIVFYLILLSLISVGVFCSRSRSSMLAMGIGLVIAAIFMFRKKPNLIYVALIVLLLTFQVFGTGSAWLDKWRVTNLFVNSAATQQQVESRSKIQATDSMDIRRIVWQGGLVIGWQNFWIGTGVETFAFAYNRFRPIAHNYTSEWELVYNKAHNELINYFATTGFLGLSSYLALIIYIVYFLVKRIKGENDQRDKFYYFTLLLIHEVIFVTNFFGFSTTTVSMWFYLSLPMIFISSEQVKIVKPVKAKVIYLIIVLVIAGWFVWQIGCYRGADVQYAQAERYRLAGRHLEATIYYQKAISLFPNSKYYNRISETLAYLALYYKDMNKHQESDRYVKLSESFGQLSLAKAPSNQDYIKTVSKNNFVFYKVTGEVMYMKNAIKLLQQAENLYPTDPRIPYALAGYYLDLAKDDKNYRGLALRQLQKAQKLKSDWQEVQELLKHFKN